MTTASLLSLFGWASGSFPVPVETCCSVARRRGQGRPSGRRGTRLALVGVEHDRMMLATGTTGKPAPTKRSALALAAVILSLFQAAPVAAQQMSQDEVVNAAIGEASLRFDLPEAWIRAVIARESAGRARAVSPKGAMGLMQLMPATWRGLTGDLALGNDPFEPRANILAGSAYLRRMYDRYGWPGFLAAYNAGPLRYERYLAGVAALPSETRSYVLQVTHRLDVGHARTPGPRAQDWRASGIFVSQGGALVLAGLEP